MPAHLLAAKLLGSASSARSTNSFASTMRASLALASLLSVSATPLSCSARARRHRYSASVGFDETSSRRDDTRAGRSYCAYSASARARRKRRWLSSLAAALGAAAQCAADTVLPAACDSSAQIGRLAAAYHKGGGDRKGRHTRPRGRLRRRRHASRERSSARDPAPRRHCQRKAPSQHLSGLFVVYLQQCCHKPVDILST